MANHDNNSHGHGQHEEHHHHILDEKTALKTFGALLVLTVITVWIAGVDLGRLNLFVAILVATVKATLVGAIFMGLKYDKKENAVIFVTSFLFLAIFIVFTGSDLFFRGDVYVKGALVPVAQAKSKFSKPWEPKPELVAHGKELYAVQCVTCHGAAGLGDGPAAAGLNPPPRNFKATDGWKNGRKPSQIFGTLTKGLNAMPSFGSLPAEDRWALAHYVETMSAAPLTDTPEDFTKAGIDTTKDTAGGDESKSVPVDFMMERMAE